MRKKLWCEGQEKGVYKEEGMWGRGEGEGEKGVEWERGSPIRVMSTFTPNLYKNSEKNGLASLTQKSFVQRLC